MTPVDDRLSTLLLAAEHAVDIAVDAMLRGRVHVKALIDKGDHGFATVVEVEIERLVRARLRREAPEIPFLGEEGGGEGLFYNGSRIRVAEREIGDPLIALSDFAFGRKHRDANRLRFAVIEELVRRSMRLRLHGSVALDLAWLAAAGCPPQSRSRTFMAAQRAPSCLLREAPLTSPSARAHGNSCRGLLSRCRGHRTGSGTGAASGYATESAGGFHRMPVAPLEGTILQ